MSQEMVQANSLSLPSQLCETAGVCFDPDNVILHGVYRDELSAPRAKRRWISTLEASFLLDSGHDFELVVQLLEEGYVLSCRFGTACGRYAFWRLTNNQAPEAQYLIETAHIPDSEMMQDEFLAVPDMCPVPDANAAYFEGHQPPPSIYPEHSNSLRAWLAGFVRRFTREL